MRRQQQHRMLLAQLQGWIEETRSYLINDILDINIPNPKSGTADIIDHDLIASLANKTKDIMNGNIKRKIKQISETEIFRADKNIISHTIDITHSVDYKFIYIYISVTLDNNLPLCVYTEISPNGNWIERYGKYL